MLLIVLPVLAVYASGLWLMNRGLQQAPVGVEDQAGFHLLPKRLRESRELPLPMQSGMFSF